MQKYIGEHSVISVGRTYLSARTTIYQLLKRFYQRAQQFNQRAAISPS